MSCWGIIIIMIIIIKGKIGRGFSSSSSDGGAMGGRLVGGMWGVRVKVWELDCRQNKGS